MDIAELLQEGFGRILPTVSRAVDGLTAEQLVARPDGSANSIAWLVWHLTRIQDDHVAGIAGVDQVWPQWRDRFGLPFGPWATGYGQSPSEAGEVRANGELLAGYHADVHAMTLDYLQRLDGTELARVVDDSWKPPVTASIRLVSVLGDTLQHLGQAAYVKGLATRAGLA